MAGSSASTSVTISTVRVPAFAAVRAAPTTSCTRCDAAAASSAATPGAASSTGSASTAAAVLRARVTLPTPSGPVTSTPSRAEPPSRTNSSGRSKVSSSHSTSRRAASVLPTRSSTASAGSEVATPVATTAAPSGVATRRPGRAPAPAATTIGAGATAVGDAGSPVTAPPSQPTHGAGADGHGAHRLDGRHGEQLGGPRAAQCAGHALARRGHVQPGRGLDVLGQQRDGVPAGQHLAEQCEPDRLRRQCGPGEPRTGEQHPPRRLHVRRGHHDRGAVGQPGVGQRDVVECGLPRRALGGRHERGGHPGPGERDRVPGMQAERVEDLGVQPDDAAPSVPGGRREPRDEGDRGSHTSHAIGPWGAGSDAASCARGSVAAGAGAAQPQPQPAPLRQRRRARGAAVPGVPAPSVPALDISPLSAPRRLVAEPPHGARHRAGPRRRPGGAAATAARAGAPSAPPWPRRAAPAPARSTPRDAGRASGSGTRCTGSARGSRRRRSRGRGTASVISTAAAEADQHQQRRDEAAGGTRTVLNDSVGSRLTISPATSSAHSPTSSGAGPPARPEVQRHVQRQAGHQRRGRRGDADEELLGERVRVLGRRSAC